MEYEKNAGIQGKESGGILKNRNFLLMLLGQIISLFGNAVLRFALPLHLLEVTGSSTLYGLVTGCAFLPMVLLTPVGGLIADRVNKRNIMVSLDFFTACLTAVFLLLYGRAGVIPLVLCTLFFLYGIAGAYQPSVQSSLPFLLRREQVIRGNAAINLVSSLSGLTGPALGGIAYSLWGILPVLALCGVCFFLSAIMELFLVIPYEKRVRKNSLAEELNEDLRQSLSVIFVKRPEIKRVLFSCMYLNFAMSALLIIGAPVLVLQTLDFPEAAASALYGFLQALLAAGGAAGGVLAGILGDKLKVEQGWKLLTVAGICLIPMGIGGGGFLGQYPSYGLLALFGAVVMGCASLFTIPMLAYVQTTVEPSLIGKVLSCLIAAASCALPAGQAVYGFLFEAFRGKEALLFFAAALFTVFVAVKSRKNFS